MYACDIDGVVANWSLGFSQLLNEIDGKNRLPIIKDHNQPDWDWKLDWYAKDILTKREKINLIENVWENHIKKYGNVLWSKLDPLYPDTMEMLNREAKKHPIIFITRRDGPGAWQETVSWLNRYGIKEPLVYCVKPGEEKGDICKKMGIKIIIDDSHRYAPELIENGVTVIMPRYTYNSEFLDGWIQPRITRVGKNMLYEVKDLQEGLITANVLINRVK